MLIPLNKMKIYSMCQNARGGDTGVVKTSSVNFQV